MLPLDSERLTYISLSHVTLSLLRHYPLVPFIYCYFVLGILKYPPKHLRMVAVFINLIKYVLGNNVS